MQDVGSSSLPISIFSLTPTMKPVFLICLLLSVVAGVTYYITGTDNPTRVEQMADIISEQLLEMRTIAYHQAVAELELQYPLEFRNNIPPAEWEAMLAAKTDSILEQHVSSRLR